MVIKIAVQYITQTRSQEISRNKTIVFYIDELWQMDLCDTSSLKQSNDGDTIILSIIYAFSKIGFARSLKDKKVPPY